MTIATAKTMLQAQSSGLTWGQIQELTSYLIRIVRPFAEREADDRMLNELERLMQNVEDVPESDWTALKLYAFRNIASPLSPVVSRLAGAGRSPFVALSCLHYCADDIQRLTGDDGFLMQLEEKIQKVIPA